MDVAVPLVFFLAFVTLVLTAPRLDAFRGRRRAGGLARELMSRHGFSAKPEFTASRLPVAGPPFHYGAAQRLTDQVGGTVDGLALTAAGYRCRYNGETHVYGVAVVSLPSPVDGIEVRHERAFHSVLVPEPVPDGRIASGEPEFDGRYRSYATDPGQARRVLSVPRVRTLAAAPQPFSWRVDGTDLLLWRSGGWESAEALIGCVRAVTSVLRPADA
ncbi:hypothetical protein AB0O91_12845 [Kitasatospora sp. NPDC089797]|uniref:hypothetical protein n=1 Tax=Kitasatospora sp. NPDC089797 TaxID=3155298 RepID=UPI00344305CF